MNSVTTHTVSASTDNRPPHKITMLNRSELSCEGITEIVGYNENEVIFETPVGRAIIGGSKLSISSLSVENGSVKVFGSILYIEYKTAKTEGFIKRMLR